MSRELRRHCVTQSCSLKDAYGFWSALDPSLREEIRAAMRVRRLDERKLKARRVESFAAYIR